MLAPAKTLPVCSNRMVMELFNSRFGSPGAPLKEIGPAQTPQAILGTPLIYALAGAILGFGFAIFAISLKTYFKL